MDYITDFFSFTILNNSINSIIKRERILDIKSLPINNAEFIINNKAIADYLSRELGLKIKINKKEITLNSRDSVYVIAPEKNKFSKRTKHISKEDNLLIYKYTVIYISVKGED